MKRLDEVYDLDDVTCEIHPNKIWPHKMPKIHMVGPIKLTKYFECPGPGIPKKREIADGI